MSDPLPPMTTTEARLALESAIKPFRSLLDLTRILDAAVAAETAAQDDADEIARRIASLERLQADIDKARAQGEEIRQENVRLVDAANATASEILHAASDKARANTEAAISAAAAKVAELSAEAEQVAERLAATQAELHVVEGKSAAVVAECAAAESTLAELQAAIARITGK